MDVVKNEPVLLAMLVQATIQLVTAFGVNVTQPQATAINLFVAVLAAVSVRYLVTPTSSIPKGN